MQARRSHPTFWLWAGAAGIAALYIGSTLLTPLYPIYERAFGFDELVVAEIYAIYVVGNLLVLFFFGRLSDQIGRKPVTLIALAVTVASALLFLFASSTAWLFAARILNGFAAGLGAGAFTAWIAELEPANDRSRSASFASAGNLGGLAFGAIFAGLLAQHAAWPLRLPFACFIVILIAMIVQMSFAPETMKHPERSLRKLSLKPRIGVPSGIRIQFVAPAAMAFTAFALGGFYAALAPGLLSQRLHVTDGSIIGAVVALFFAAGALTIVATRTMKSRMGLFVASALLVTGLVLLLLADAAQSMIWLLVATIVTGAAMALGYRSSLEIINEIAPAEQRAEVVSTYLLVCYTANAIPVIGVGLLALATGPENAHRVFAGVLAALGIVACVIGARYLPRK